MSNKEEIKNDICTCPTNEIQIRMTCIHCGQLNTYHILQEELSTITDDNYNMTCKSCGKVRNLKEWLTNNGI